MSRVAVEGGINLLRTKFVSICESQLKIAIFRSGDAGCDVFPPSSSSHLKSWRGKVFGGGVMDVAESWRGKKDLGCLDETYREHADGVDGLLIKFAVTHLD